jgi:ribosomal protein S18 acetylase RimI-like enzyme
MALISYWEGGVSRQVTLAELSALREAEASAASASPPQSAIEQLEAEVAEMSSIQAAMVSRATECDSDMSIEEVQVLSSELTAAMARLMPQLSGSRPPPTAEHLAAVLASREVALFVARLAPSAAASSAVPPAVPLAAPPIVGAVSLVTFNVPSGRRAAVEDLVVDSSARGRGIGRLLLECALDAARKKGVLKVELTSRPSRVAANALYQRAGFTLRETNCYSLAL